MCGIFGIVTRSGRGEVELILDRAVGALAHRGPDDAGRQIFHDERSGMTVGLGHRRLSILDLSSAGHQPMVDQSTGNSIVYNGEVFNFRQLRQEMETAGHRFESETDTEVILKSFGARGIEAITPWRGMFAFGIWEQEAGRLSLVRDRLGIKPLYYFEGADFFIFGSEIRALLASGLVPRRLSRVGVESFLSYGSVEDPLTIIEGIYAVLPGHRLEYRDGRVESKPYWEIRVDERAKEELVPKEELVDEIASLTREAVRLRTVADVPISLFLSGGIDSSAILSLLRQEGSSDIRTFSVNFREAEYNEQAYAELVARRYGTVHTSVMLTEVEVLAKIPAALGSLDQPSIDGINTWVVSEATAAAGLKVALSGLGGDEGFLGYRYFRTIARDEKLRKMVSHVPEGLRAVASAAIRATSTGASATKLSELLRSGSLDLPTVKLRRKLFTDRQREELIRSSPDPIRSIEDERARKWHAAWTARQMENCRNGDSINQASALELGGYLPNTLLRDTDVMSMAHGLEVRVPLLDHLLIERLLRIDGRVKLGYGLREVQKWLLVRAAGDLPAEIVERRKRGFEIPFALWFRGALRSRIEESLRAPGLERVLNREAVERVWSEFLAGRTTWSRVWALFVLSNWIETHLDESDYHVETT